MMQIIPFNLNETKFDINADFNNFLLYVNHGLAAPQSNFLKSIKINALGIYSAIRFDLKQKRCILNTLSKHARKVLFWKGFYAISEISDLNDKNSRVIIF